jgi:hypothetical protein
MRLAPQSEFQTAIRAPHQLIVEPLFRAISTGAGAR